MNTFGICRTQSAFCACQHLVLDIGVFNLDGKGPAIPYLVRPTAVIVGNAMMGTREVLWKKLPVLNNDGSGQSLVLEYAAK